ncbi:MAG: polysaccharide deacetylase [Lachnospiraceae bacterium]|nr:polysaccharide deacetylase [Lachnospiraceae bacterium]
MDHRFEKILLKLMPVIVLIPCLICVCLASRVTGLERMIEGREAYEELGARESRLVELTGYEAEYAAHCAELTRSLKSNTSSEPAKETGEEDLRDTVSKADPDDVQVNLVSGTGWNGVHKVYLTFDDGPSIYTDDILDILAEYGVKATFFVIGRDNPVSYDRYIRIVEEGHTLGMHSYTHIYDEIYASPESFAEDTQRLRTLLEEVTGVTPRFYRFPGGSSNNVSATDVNVLADYLASEDIVYFDWNVSSGDASGNSITSEQIIRNALYGIEDRETTVILLHDTASKWTTVRALPGLIEAIQAMDNTVILPITDDTTVIHHSI